MDARVSPGTYGLLGQLATRTWTGYELTHQVRRSLRFLWPVSEAHLYREQQRLVALGWATVTQEPAGRRTRNRYAITEEGRVALAGWLASEAEEPHLQLEAALRLFNGDHTDPATLAAVLAGAGEQAASMLEELVAIAREYLAEDGPLRMLEQGVGGPDERRSFHDRPMFPERLHVVAMTIDLATAMFETLATFLDAAAEEVAAWPTTTDPSLTAATRERLEAVAARRGGPS